MTYRQLKVTPEMAGTAISLIEAGAKIADVAADMGTNVPTLRSHIELEMGRRAGNPSYRAPDGKTTPEGKVIVRRMIMKGATNTEIIRACGISATAVCNERRNLNLERLRQRLPIVPTPPMISDDNRKLACRRLEQGHDIPAIAKELRLDQTTIRRVRDGLVLELSRNGVTLPGCDLMGRQRPKAVPDFRNVKQPKPPPPPKPDPTVDPRWTEALREAGGDEGLAIQLLRLWKGAELIKVEKITAAPPQHTMGGVATSML